MGDTIATLMVDSGIVALWYSNSRFFFFLYLSVALKGTTEVPNSFLLLSWIC